MPRKRQKHKTYELEITSLSDEGRGIAYSADKIIFVSGALPGEKVIAKRAINRAKYEEADALEVITKADNRITPKCAVFGVCGGCSLQYISSAEQITIKQNWLKNAFLQQAKITPEILLPPLHEQSWGYRHRARLGVRYVIKKNKVLVGFRERKSSFITDMDSCEVLHPSIGKNLVKLSLCISKLSIKDKIAQIEVAIGENTTILILRNLAEFSSEDKEILLDCAQQLNIIFYTQSGGTDTVKPLVNEVSLIYSHPDHNIVIEFLATDFVQVNFAINRKMVNLALTLLDLNANDTVIDLFCGLGNFSLPIARYVKYVVGVDGDLELINRAKYNATKNNISNADFYKADLFQDVVGFEWFRGKKYNKALIDPARTGAIEIIELLPKLAVEKIVYVSCNPATLARDTKRLLELGYVLKSAGIIDMFAQTAHVESIALFIKK